ncbi:MAG: TetR/AcrR family transcriptional regulator [Clostridia bacterium]|nr:TetR/AcrR family transcriptional regulator [Clostridia bacterium]
MEKMNTKDTLIEAGIREIHTYGMQNFSIRRIAAACGVSCATPYKHFKDRDDFILAMFRYVNRQWYAVQSKLVAAPLSPKEQILETCITYIHFLVDNASYHSLVLTKNENLNEIQIKERSEISEISRRLIDTYCREVNMPEEDRLRKTFLVRSLLYGAAIMIDNGQLENSEATYDMIRATIAREFDLP